MPQLVSALSWQSLTATVNALKPPATFLQEMFFRARNTHPTEYLEIGKWIGDRKMVPFVKKGAEAYPIGGLSTAFRAIEAPNIRVKMGFKPDPLFFGRTPGSRVFLSGGETQVDEVQRKIARDFQYMNDQIENRIEWLCAQALEGVIDYSKADDDHAEAFQFDYARDGGFTVALGAGDRWNEGTSDIAGDVRYAADKVMEETGLNVTDAICGSLAADAFLNNAKVQEHVERRRPEGPGTPLLLGGRPSPRGARYLGSVYGVNWWAYTRQVKDIDGSAVDLINTKKVFLLPQDGEFSIEFGAIPDIDAFESGQLEAQKFSKSWTTEDPSLMWVLMHTRPFPLMRRPEAVFEYQVLA